MQRSSSLTDPAQRRPAPPAGIGAGACTSALPLRRWTRPRSKAEDTLVARIDAAEALLRAETWARILEMA
ncbi:hypothetical protein [Labrys wisconsinensis]|uniref:Uncharacterized protein n=1 Tax=Labrys wisconsinensis TaxID=425677 RepID=A0ABU0J6N3_9HYPH|nr:hypothetical protein [Labrys wisconsinensis]MDQ0469216.1 hypothetical protein [Labrys wisconsinensis]